jgi:hypothetical protein
VITRAHAWACLGIALLIAMAALVFTSADATGAATETPQAGSYGLLTPLAGEDPALCLEDHTGDFPVAEAAAEFEGIVTLSVTNDCAGHANVVEVVTVIRNGETWSGWYNAPRPERDGHALISLNLTEAYRMTPDAWRAALVHEIGHALGLGHAEGLDSVMDPIHYAEAGGLTELDRVQLLSLYGGAR